MVYGRFCDRELAHCFQQEDDITAGGYVLRKISAALCPPPKCKAVYDRNLHCEMCETMSVGRSLYSSFLMTIRPHAFFKDLTRHDQHMRPTPMPTEN